MKICVSDDEKEVRESIIHKLKTLFPEFEIFDVEFGCIALERIRLVRPNLVFMDIRMPEMDGLEILHFIRKELPDVQVVILSGYDDFEYARKALQLGAVDYILKPADREQLRDNVDKARQKIENAFLREMETFLGKLSERYLFVHDICCFNTSLWFDERQRKQIHLGDSEQMIQEWEAESGNILMSFKVNSDYGGIIVSSSGGDQAGFCKKSEFIPAC